MRLPIIKYRNVWFAVSGALVALSVAALVAFPLKYGIDFTGGSLLEVKFAAARPASVEVSEALKDLQLGEIVVQTIDADSALLRFKHVDDAEHLKVVETLRQKYEGLSETRFESIGPSVGDDLRRSALWSVTLVLLGIASYVAYAFRKVSHPVESWKYGLTTLLKALFHDVLISVGLLAVLGRYLNVEVNSGIVAAVLTILGFAVHDNIVVFDRIRENLIKTGGSFEEIVERSVNDTLARSINTSFTSLLALVAIFLWGGESLRWFALTMIVGLTAGTYSSIFLASPLLVVFQKRSGR